jgi:hypothetical protein
VRSIAVTRDQKLLDGIMKHKYLIPGQAGELFFTTIENDVYREKKAAARLLSLYRKKLINRFRVPGDPFIYTASGSRYSTKMIHYLAITDVLLEIKKLLPSSSALEYEVEYHHNNVIADLYICYSNHFRGESREYFIEVELESSGNIIDKIQKYERFIENEKLIIVCKHHRVVERIRSEEYYIPVQAIDLQYIKEQWHW